MGLHLLANHPETGLLDYQGVLTRLKDPAVFALESSFLIVVTFHALNGLRGVLLDYVSGKRAERLASATLSILGWVAVGYGLWLSTILYLR